MKNKAAEQEGYNDSLPPLISPTPTGPLIKDKNDEGEMEDKRAETLLEAQQRRDKEYDKIHNINQKNGK